ncbi:AMIN-like domain-containing (lipo)protein [Ornithinimicrobium sp. W1665]|uniref:AMIN-like domain-containing (lipo)protein n=1 Tax=Ornithinimicrobium sp. W1665 TaxID=3416666 RepID=UPI003CF83907
MRRAAAATAVVVLLLAGCQEDGDDPSGTPAGTSAPADAATSTPSDATTTTDDGAGAPGTTEDPGTTTGTEDERTGEVTEDPTDPGQTSGEPPDDATEEPGTVGDEPTGTGSEQALPPWTDDPQERASAASDEPQEITGVRTGLHEDFDRVVLDLTGDRPVLGWFVGPVDEAVEDPTGFSLGVEGEAFVEVSVRGIDWTTESPERYDGDRVLGAGTEVLTEVVLGGLFEGQQQVVLGLREETDYRIFTLSDPARIVVDVRHP